MTPQDAELIHTVVDFWFGPPGSGRRTEWFHRDIAFDRACAETLGDLSDRAVAGAGRGLRASADGCLALVILLDQIPRNIHRGRAASFAGDDRARATADHAIACGFDLVLPPERRLFLYLPFEHAETLADQDRAVALMATLNEPDWPGYAEQHRAVIARFGRFPHRNAALGRESTAAELAWLAEGGGF